MTKTQVEPAEIPDLDGLREAAAGCTRCGLYRNATRTVFGSRARDVSVVLVGEQPGDREDRAGLPFVGPAGRLLDRALDDANIDRDQIYLTNMVKHFKFEQRGKRRQKPSADEIRACRPWLDAELRVLRPSLLVTLGATAAHALLGRSFRLTQHRGEVLSWTDDIDVVPTVHPSSILRIPDESRRQAFQDLVADLKVVAGRIKQAAPATRTS